MSRATFDKPAGPSDKIYKWIEREIFKAKIAFYVPIETMYSSSRRKINYKRGLEKYITKYHQASILIVISIRTISFSFVSDIMPDVIYLCYLLIFYYTIRDSASSSNIQLRLRCAFTSSTCISGKLIAKFCRIHCFETIPSKEQV